MIYASQTTPLPNSDLKFARSWTAQEWVQVCVLRAQLDALLLELDSPTIDSDSIELLRQVGPKLPCYALASGCYVLLHITPPGAIFIVPDEIAGRIQLQDWIDRGGGYSERLHSLPTMPGLYTPIRGFWVQQYSHALWSPSALVMHPSLLTAPTRWMTAEVRHRALARGLDETQCLELQRAAARWLLEYGNCPDASTVVSELSL